MSDSPTSLRIGIVGAGRIGATLARLFTEAGHEVMLANSRDPSTLADTLAELGERAHAATPAEALRFGDVDVVSIPLFRVDDLPTDGVAGKVVIDTNNYYAERDGQIAELDDGSSSTSELLQRHIPDARVVKAFNAINWLNLARVGRPAGTQGRVALPISGDDADAKRVVAGLIDEIGFDVVDAGRLGEGGRRHEPGTPPYNELQSAEELRRSLA
jgi:predicted dinucleotide-binding enzyme